MYRTTEIIKEAFIYYGKRGARRTLKISKVAVQQIYAYMKQAQCKQKKLLYLSG